MENKRLIQIIFMFSFISNRTLAESEKIVLNTETGRAIQDNNVDVLYEQQTENLYSIAMELRKDAELCELANLFTIEAIKMSMQELGENERKKRAAPLQVETKVREPELVQKSNKQIKQAMKQALQVKNQNLMNARRIENANKLKG